jgi:hypothetical protein
MRAALLQFLQRDGTGYKSRARALEYLGAQVLRDHLRYFWKRYCMLVHLRENSYIRSTTRRIWTY